MPVKGLLHLGDGSDSASCWGNLGSRNTRWGTTKVWSSSAKEGQTGLCWPADLPLLWQSLIAESTAAHISSSASQEVHLVPCLPLVHMLCAWSLQDSTTVLSLKKASAEPLGCATVFCKMSGLPTSVKGQSYFLHSFSSGIAQNCCAPQGWGRPKWKLHFHSSLSPSISAVLPAYCSPTCSSSRKQGLGLNQ